MRFFPPGQIPEFADMLSMQRRPAAAMFPTLMLVLAMVGLASGAYWVLKGRANAEAQAKVTQEAVLKNWIRTMGQLRDDKSWREALEHLKKAPNEIPQTDIINLQTVLTNERSFKESLRRALAKKATKNWSEALEDLQAIPKNSVYFDEAEQHRIEVRDAFVRLELDLAQAALAKTQLDKAASHLSSAEIYAPDRREVRQVRHQLNTARNQDSASAAGASRPAAAQTVASTTQAKAAKPRKLTAKALISKANQKLIQNDVKGALPLLRQALKKRPKNAQIHRGLGICYATLGNNAAARKHYLEYLRLAPNSPDAPQLRKMLGLQ
jgi:tetratricopeptide (TPR) repeat protein